MAGRRSSCESIERPLRICEPSLIAEGRAAVRDPLLPVVYSRSGHLRISLIAQDPPCDIASQVPSDRSRRV